MWNKKALSYQYLSFTERFEERVKKVRMSDSRINNKIKKFIENLDCD